MKIKVLTINSELDSVTKLGWPTKTFHGDYAEDFDDTIMIRWGNSRTIHNRDGKSGVDFKHVLNGANKIRTNCEKSKSKKLMSRVVNIPTLWEKRVPADVLAVVRPLEHSAGSGFSVKKGPFTLESGTYATRYLDVTKEGGEYRVWFCGNQTMCGRRYKMECNTEEQFPCRSLWGYEFCGGISKDLHNQTLLAAKQIGLDFGAADVLFYKGQWYFLELNTAPSLDHRIVREFYQTSLKILIDKKFPESVLVPVVVINTKEIVKKKEAGENVNASTELIMG